MTIESIPILRRNPDGTSSIAGYATSIPCANCGTLTPVRAMVQDRRDHTFHCVECPGEDWLRRVYGRQAVADLIALREGKPGALSLEELKAKYPERTGARRRDTCMNGHPFTPESTIVRRDGRRECRICHNAGNRARKARGAA